MQPKVKIIDLFECGSIPAAEAAHRLLLLVNEENVAELLADLPPAVREKIMTMPPEYRRVLLGAHTTIIGPEEFELLGHLPSEKTPTAEQIALAKLRLADETESA
ncbi:hypothetical protein [Blastopirellula marina]|uniref:Uncharacterized protein n=1 Tax=Blastopirellula marina DSM 3645 TaxID=314230 RepID=A3ZRX7_9BACT|nr:hypothetical protein [Blastopirellula marina]EAQ80899.1 hypothetical protein DSM3645_12801 [Blastopirellula marina DSM 3645]